MSCMNPMLMAKIDLSNCSLLAPRYREEGWKFKKDTMIAYRLVSRESRDLLLEKIPSYVKMEVIEVPCSGCIGCRLDYSKDWANRCSLEALSYDHNYFITLTYDDDHLHYGQFGNPTIYKPDKDRFIKELRTKFKRKFNFDGIRVFGCQEYGDLRNRPHMHMILFNCPIPDLTIDFIDPTDGSIIHKKNQMTGGWYKTSKFIQDLWPYGFVVIDEANWNTEAYVSRYIMKKQKGKNKKIYTDTLGIEPPYLFMSTHPAIGSKYLDEHYDELVDNPVLISHRPYKRPLVGGLPRAFKKKIQERSPSEYEKMQEHAIEKQKANRSLLAGKQLINDNRANLESKIISKSYAFQRDI